MYICAQSIKVMATRTHLTYTHCTEAIFVAPERMLYVIGGGMQAI